MKREFVVTPSHDGRGRIVVIETALPNGKVRISIDGQSRDIDARAIRPGTWSIILDQHSFIVDVARPSADEPIIVSVGGDEIPVAIEDALRHKFATSAAAGRTASPRGELVRAPIAGKVVKLLVAVGDAVPPHTSVIAIEAMKMENELVCERGGTVTAIHKTIGQSVDRGEVLVEFS